jgi:hypothetical protein
LVSGAFTAAHEGSIGYRTDTCPYMPRMPFPAMPVLEPTRLLPPPTRGVGLTLYVRRALWTVNSLTAQDALSEP